MDISIQLLQAVFFLAAAQKKELCYNPEDGEIYQVTNRSKTDVTLLPLHGAEAPIVDFNPDKLIFRNDISQRSQNIAFGTHENAFETLSERTNQRLLNVEPTFGNRIYNIGETQTTAEPTPDPHNFIGVGKVDLPRFSTLYTGETAKISAQIEDLLDKVFAATNYSKTIDKTIANYNTAKKLAKNGQLYELKQLAERLQGRINKQAAMQSAMNTMAAQQQAHRKMIFSAVAVAVIALLYFGITHFYKSAPTTPTETETTATTSQQTELDKAIREWEQATGKKIYPYGRKCLEKNCKGMSKDQIIRVIEYNI